MANPETKPTAQTVTWCESGTPTTDIDANGGDVAHGWPSTTSPPPRQRFNWVFKWLMQAVRYLFHRGIPDYDAAEYYGVGDRVQDGAGNTTYKCILANGPGAAKSPATEPTYWEPWGFSPSTYNQYVKYYPGMQGDVSMASGTVDQAFAYSTTGIGTSSKMYVILAHATVAGGAANITGTIGGDSAFVGGIAAATVSVFGDNGYNVGICSVYASGTSTFSARWLKVTGSAPATITLCITLWGE